MRRAPRDMPVAGLMQVPRGTKVTILADANKPLVAVQIDDVADEECRPPQRIDCWPRRGEPARTFSFDLRPTGRRQDAAVHAARHRRHSQPRGGAAGALGRGRRAAAGERAAQGHRHGDHARCPIAGRGRSDRRLWRGQDLVRRSASTKSRRASGRLAMAGRRRGQAGRSTTHWKLATWSCSPSRICTGPSRRPTAATEPVDPTWARASTYVLDVVTPEQLRRCSKPASWCSAAASRRSSKN